MRKMKLEKPRSLTEIVVERLKEAIINGEIGLGENISEEKLAKGFGVSRSPVRDALSILQLQGFVTVKPKKGSFVFTPTIEDVVHICEHREILEMNAADLAVRKAKQKMINELEAVISDMDAAMSREDTVAYEQLDTYFHQLFFTHCGNPYLNDSFNLVSGRVAALRTHLTSPEKKLRELSFSEHKQFVELLLKEELGEFRKLLARHINRTLKVYIEALKTPKEVSLNLST